jgi:C4-dicarboxylate transporter DctQ subunit
MKGGCNMKKFIDHFEEYILSASLLIMTFITFSNVLARKVFSASWAFTEEITTALFILSSLLGAAVAAKKGSHMGLSVLTDLLPKKQQKYVALSTVIAAMIFCGFLIKYGFDMVQSEMKFGQTTPAMGWPEWVFGLFVPVGGIFMAIRFIQYGINAFKEKEER